MYNTWDKQERERDLRYERKQLDQTKKHDGKQNSNNSLYNTSNTATSGTSNSPSTAVTNRPIQTQGDTKQVEENGNYNF